MMEREAEHLDPEDRRILGLEATDPSARSLTPSEFVGRVFGAAILAIALTSVLAMIGMLAAWWLLWMYGALFG